MEKLTKGRIVASTMDFYIQNHELLIGPPLFLWLTTTDQCWPGVLRLPSLLASGRRGIGMPEIWGKLTFRPNLCYFATCEKNWLREEDRLGDFTRAKRLQNLVGTEIAMAAA
jgi:hypothetical protein